MGGELEQRVIELESRWAFQDEALRKLEELATEQARELYRLSGEVTALRAKLLSLAPSLMARPEEEAPPPHY